MHKKSYRLNDKTVLDFGRSGELLLQLRQVGMEALLLVVIEVGPVGKHALAQELIDGQELLGVVDLVLVVLCEKAIPSDQLAERCLANYVGTEVTGKAVVVAVWALLGLHVHVADEALGKAARQFEYIVVERDIVH